MNRPVWARCGGVFAGVAEAAFPDAHNPPPAGWTGPVFRLSQTYPATLPTLEPVSQRKWTQFDFKNPMQAPQYLKAVLDYCFEGNTVNNLADVSQNPVRTWYHAPWLHADSRNDSADGREFIHGLTKERTDERTNIGRWRSGTHANAAEAGGNNVARGISTVSRQFRNDVDPEKRLLDDPELASRLSRLCNC